MISKITLPVKLGLLGLVPLSAIAGLVTMRVADDFAEASQLSAVADEVRRVDLVGQIIEEVDNEISTLNELGADDSDVVAQRARVDASIAALLADRHGSAPETIERVEEFRDRLPALRQLIPSSPSTYRLSGAAVGRTVFAADDSTMESMSTDAVTILEATRAFDSFTEQLRTATAFDDELLVEGSLAADIATLQLFDQYAEVQNEEGQIAVAMASLPASARTEAVLAVGLSANAQVDLWRSAIDELGTSDLVESFGAVADSDAAQRVSGARSAISSLEPGQPLSISAADVQDAYNEQRAELQALRSSLSAATISQADAVGADASRSAYVTMAIAALFVAVVGGLIYLLYVSIRKPLRRVTQRSLEVATVELPGVVNALRADVDAELPKIESIHASTNDEIGQLVEAFNQMSATALDLAGEQAMARRAVGDMFMNLGRRNQKLLNRMLRNLDSLQRNEQDPQALQALYEVDHLTTRMRRNAESLLILAGAEQTRRFAEPVAAGDVVRAALAEVENFQRVEILGDTGQRIRGEYVADLTHLLAELVENALAFSPPDTTVQVTTRMTQRGYMFTVNDDGVGMPADKLEIANRRIAQAATQEETPSKFLGLFVVGRLAARRKIEVRLFDSPSGGVAVRAALPDTALFVDGDDVLPADITSFDQTPAAAVQSAVEAQQASVPLPESAPQQPIESPAPPPVAAAPIVEPDIAAPEPTPTPEPTPMPAAVAPPPASTPTVSTAPTAPVAPVAAAATDSANFPALQAALASIQEVADMPLDGPASDLARPVSDANRPLSQPTADGLPAPSPITPMSLGKFGATARRPGANLPQTALTTEIPATPVEPASNDSGHSPDAVRRSLSGFQTGTGRADREDAAHLAQPSTSSTNEQGVGQ